MNSLYEYIPIIIIFLICSFLVFTLVERIFVTGLAITRISRFLLILWGFFFIYWTQIMPFSNEIKTSINYVPFKPLITALKYGSINSRNIDQILFNGLICIPLGFLFPLTVREKKIQLYHMAVMGMGLSGMTKLMQYFSMQGCDINEFIANIIGILIGFSCYKFMKTAGILLSQKKLGQPVRSYVISAAFWISILILGIMPKLAIWYAQSNAPYGYIYYGNSQPTEMVIDSSISDEGVKRSVYQYIETESEKQLLQRLKEKSGFKGKYVDGTLADGQNKRIFIYSDHTWCINYYYGIEKDVNKELLPDDAAGEKQAIEDLQQLGIDSDNLKYAGLAKDYADGYLHLTFEDKSVKEKQIVWGNVEVTLGEYGELISVNDNRITCNFYDEIMAVSPKDSLKIVNEVGTGDWSGTAYVNKAEASYYFNKTTGYLIPTWRAEAILTAKSGEKYAWSANLGAIP